MPSNITFKNDVFGKTGISMLVTMDGFARDYINQSGGVEIGPLYSRVPGFREVTV